MGEILGPALLVLAVVAALAAWFQHSHSSTTQRRALLKVPAVILPDGEPPDVLLANAVTNFTLAQRAVRLLDRLSEQPETATISDRDRKEAKSIVDAFYGK